MMPKRDGENKSSDAALFGKADELLLLLLRSGVAGGVVVEK